MIFKVPSNLKHSMILCFSYSEIPELCAGSRSFVLCERRVRDGEEETVGEGSSPLSTSKLFQTLRHSI